MATKLKASSGIFTFTGKIIDPLNPDPADIDIRDIAHSLSQQVRFTGHTRDPYTVAQHSVLVSAICDPKDAAHGLLHDGTEGYLSDLARPIKQAAGLGEAYQEVEDALWIAIADHFGIDRKMPASVKKADYFLLVAEMRDQMPEGVLSSPFLDEDIKKGMASLTYSEFPEIICWNHKQAHGEFMLRFMELF